MKEKQQSGNVKEMKRNASDNEYFHRDFHISMNNLLKYIYDSYGKDQLINYLKQYSEAHFYPMNKKLRTGDLDVLVHYFEDIYKKEKWPVKISTGKDYIEIVQDACPGISFIRSRGETPCPFYRETYETVYSVMCNNTPFIYELQYFDDHTGACKQYFRRKETEK